MTIFFKSFIALYLFLSVQISYFYLLKSVFNSTVSTVMVFVILLSTFKHDFHLERALCKCEVISPSRSSIECEFSGFSKVQHYANVSLSPHHVLP